MDLSSFLVFPASAPQGRKRAEQLYVIIFSPFSFRFYRE